MKQSEGNIVPTTCWHRPPASSSPSSSPCAVPCAGSRKGIEHRQRGTLPEPTSFSDMKITGSLGSMTCGGAGPRGRWCLRGRAGCDNC